MENDKTITRQSSLKMIENEETTKSGIILSSGAKEKPQVAEIIEVGPGGEMNRRKNQ